MSNRFFFVLWAVFAVLCACGSDEKCEDKDLDGYGSHCELGDDCDDTNPLRTQNCDTVLAPDCEANPTATGCPCLVGASSVCYNGDAATLGVGQCVGGQTQCIHGYWGLCEGSLLPAIESCNAEDDDCDGIVDDGVQSPCGDCAPGCTGAIWGNVGEPFTANDTTDVTAHGYLTLARGSYISPFIWVVNSAEATVSKIDANSAIEVARYASGGAEPSRVAVDYRGDAWVANRAFLEQSTVTKIAGSSEHCVDRGVPGIQTSTGPTDVLPAGEDDCVLFTVDVPQTSPNAVARALAVDGDKGVSGLSGGDVWVGLYEARQLVELDGQTGQELQRLDIPNFQPYAATFDPWGRLWMSSQDGYLARVDRTQNPLLAEVIEVPLACYTLYSLAVDTDGKIFMTGFSCNDVASYDPLLNQWDAIATSASPRGMSAWKDWLWTAHTEGLLSKIFKHPLSVGSTFSLSTEGVTPVEAIGVGIDAKENVWVISSQGGGTDVGVATKFSVTEERVVAQVPVGQAPHTQGDLSGANLVGGFVELGQQTHVFEGCASGTTVWERLHIQAQTHGLGSIEVAIRHAATQDALSTTTFQTLGTLPTEVSPFPLVFPQAGVVEVQLMLRATAYDGAPYVEYVGMEWECLAGSTTI